MEMPRAHREARLLHGVCRRCCIAIRLQAPALISSPGYAKAARRGKSSARAPVPARIPELTGAPRAPRISALQGHVSKTVEFADHIIGDVDVLRDQTLASAGELGLVWRRGEQLADLAHRRLGIREIVDQLI